MHDRLVIAVTAILVGGIALAGFVVPLLHTDPSYALPFDLLIRAEGSASVNSTLAFSIQVVEHSGWPAPVGTTFLSLDLGGTFRVVSSDGGDNPWGRSTIWNVTGVTFAAPVTYHVNATVVSAGSVRVQAMLWGPRGDLTSVQVDDDGGVNPATVSVLGSGSLCLELAGTGGMSIATVGVACEGPTVPT